MSDRFNFYGHDAGLVITQPESGKFVERPMTRAELLAREPAHEISTDIYRHANFAGVCYHEIWELIASAFGPEISRLTARVAELESYWTGSKLTGGHDVCHTCAAHLVAINDLRSLIRRMAVDGYSALAPHEKDEIAVIAAERAADETGPACACMPSE